jgi:oligoribonuclease (3'-5' exoribonuclease)
MNRKEILEELDTLETVLETCLIKCSKIRELLTQGDPEVTSKDEKERKQNKITEILNERRKFYYKKNKNQ